MSGVQVFPYESENVGAVSEFIETAATRKSAPVVLIADDVYGGEKVPENSVLAIGVQDISSFLYFRSSSMMIRHRR